MSSYYLIAAAALLAQLAPLILFSVRARPEEGLVALNVGGVGTAEMRERFGEST